jgi:hypothetical protein
MGHGDLRTTMRYLHFRQRDDEADMLSEAFEENGVPKLVPKTAFQEPTRPHETGLTVRGRS